MIIPPLHAKFLKKCHHRPLCGSAKFQWSASILRFDVVGVTL
jgi:hypothetical protein